MIVGFILIMMVIGAGLILGLYSMYMPFLQDLGNIKFYNVAHYAAISSIERASLVLRYHGPGFVGSGGRKGDTVYGGISDSSTGDFGLISKENNGMFWTIDSRTQTIPAVDKGNIDPLFNEFSTSFNKLGYNVRERIFLSFDATTDPSQYYIGSGPVQNFSGDTVSMQLRINPVMFSGYTSDAQLDATDNDIDDDGVTDDEIISRSRNGYYDAIDPDGPREYRILPLIDIAYYGTSAVIKETDRAIRETVINDVFPVNDTTGYNVIFDNTMQPIRFPNNGGSRTNSGVQNVISPYADSISGDTFTQIMANTTDYTDTSLVFSLVNILKNTAGQYYPFLEYAIDANGQEIADRFYTIRGVGRVGEYEVEVGVKKPTSNEGIAGDFTIIF